MKAIVALVGLSIVAYIQAETCHNVDDCVLTECGADHLTLGCFGSVCTCATDYSCEHLDECTFLGNCTFLDHVWHCVDNRCMCRPSLPGTGGGIGGGFPPGK